MSGPGVVCIKRKRSLPAPERLIVEPPGKKPKHHVHYILQRDEELIGGKSNGTHAGTQEGIQSEATANKFGISPVTVNRPPGGGVISQPVFHTERRTFHLKRPNAADGGVRKRKQGDHGIATFIERHAKRRTPGPAGSQTGEGDASESKLRSESFKRPSKRAAIPDSAVPASAVAGHDLEGIAESLHQFALEEAAKEKPKVLRTPKLSGQRSREIHQQRISSAAAKAQQQNIDIDMDKDEDTDYVYDTYVLAPTTSAGAAQVEAQGSSGSVGYLVITEEDQKIWEDYIEDEPSDKDWNSDEDDENAEDWYGADYPEEELAMDDEFDEDPYKYHNPDLSDDEGWNSNDQGWSDDEYERQLQPWNVKTAKRYRKYLEGGETENKNDVGTDAGTES